MAEKANQNKKHDENQKDQEEVTFNRYAIFQTGGKQYQAIENKTIAVEKIDKPEGESIEFKEVLMRKLNTDSIEIGQPYVSTPIKASIVKHTKAPKLIVFKFKRRKGHMRKQGHRQPLTVIRIESI